MTNPKTKISDKAQLATEIYGEWPVLTIEGLQAMKELNEITRAVLGTNQCQYQQ